MQGVDVSETGGNLRDLADRILMVQGETLGNLYRLVPEPVLPETGAKAEAPSVGSVEELERKLHRVLGKAREINETVCVLDGRV